MVKFKKNNQNFPILYQLKQTFVEPSFKMI